VVVPYGPSTVSEYKRRLANEDKILSFLSATVKNKTKLVAWIVSNCDATSGRGRYVEELKKHIAIDIYGKCGSLKCDNKSGNADNFHPPTGCCKLGRVASEDYHSGACLYR